MDTRFLTSTVVVLASAWSLRAWGAEFIGSESCKVCHPAAYEAWQDSQHSRAAGALSPRQQKDGRCLSCHSPEQAKGNADVSCESCHGGGQYYAPKYVMKDAELSRAVGMIDPSEKMCLKCHDVNAPSMVPFKFADKLKLIDHWSAERAAKKERSSKPERSTKSERAKKEKASE
jgi:hypothetical protein